MMAKVEQYYFVKLCSNCECVFTYDKAEIDEYNKIRCIDCRFPNKHEFSSLVVHESNFVEGEKAKWLTKCVEKTCEECSSKQDEIIEKYYRCGYEKEKITRTCRNCKKSTVCLISKPE